MAASGHGPASCWDGRITPPAIAVFSNYADAERAVDRLSDLGFPVERVAIIGDGLKTVEQVTGRLNYGGAALKGAVSGALPGALIGWIFGLFNLISPLVAAIALAFYGLIIGAVVGAILGLIMHALQGGRRDFDAVTMMVPRHFEVVVDEEVADEAARLLADGAPAQTPHTEPGLQLAGSEDPDGHLTYRGAMDVKQLRSCTVTHSVVVAQRSAISTATKEPPHALASGAVRGSPWDIDGICHTRSHSPPVVA